MTSFGLRLQDLATRLTLITKFGNSATFEHSPAATYDEATGRLVGDVAAGTFTIGITYKIVAIGTTDFTAVGASANTVGLTFVATGAGTGTGTATAPVILATTIGGPRGVNPRLINGDTIQEADQTIVVEASRLGFTPSLTATKVTIASRIYTITDITPSKVNDVTVAFTLVIR